MNEIITDLEKLSERSDEIDVAKQGKLVQETNIKLKTIIKEQGLTALSAPAIGIAYRIFVIKFGDKLKCFINPMIQKAEGLELSREKCSSIPDKEFIRPRNNKIHVIYSTPLGKIESVMLAGKAATVFQHEMDHLDGLLISDVGLEIDKDFDEATEEEKQEVLSAYLSSISEAAKQFNEDLSTDEETKETWNAAKFITSFAEGNIEIEKKELSNRKKKQLNKILKMFKKKGIKI